MASRLVTGSIAKLMSRVAARCEICTYSSPTSYLINQRIVSTRTVALVNSSSCARAFASSPEASKLLQIVQGDIAHEKSNYEPPAVASEFLKKLKWKFHQKDGDVNMCLTREVDGMDIAVEFQLVSPFQGEEGAEGSTGGEGSQGTQAEMTDFSVTITREDGRGMTFYCTTLQNDDNFRYMIGNVRQFKDKEEKAGVSCYNGPEFEDLDDKLQEALDEWLEKMGVDSELCDFIDAMAVDKEQKEYMYWLDSCAKFLDK